MIKCHVIVHGQGVEVFEHKGKRYRRLSNAELARLTAIRNDLHSRAVAIRCTNCNAQKDIVGEPSFEKGLSAHNRMRSEHQYCPSDGFEIITEDGALRRFPHSNIVEIA